MADAPTIDLSRIAKELNLQTKQVENVTRLLDEGNTVPFITRYRKEVTGDLNEDAIRQIRELVHSQRQLVERANTILRLIEAQGKLTPKLRKAIQSADSLKRLDDLYLPFRPKRKSRAETARQRGLEPLADRIWNGDESIGNPESAAAEFVDPTKELEDTTAVLKGVNDLIAERIGDSAEARELARRNGWKTGRLVVKATKATKTNKGQTESEAKEFQNYDDYTESVARIPPHRVMAINRGEKSKALRVRFEWNDETVAHQLQRHFNVDSHRYAPIIQAGLVDALERIIQPGIDREIRRELADKSESHAVSVFAQNLKSLLMQPPLRGRRVVAIDPGLRSGCKLAALDEYGKLCGTDLFYVTGSADRKVAAKQKVAAFVKEHNCQLIAIGNGTACRETEELVAETISEELSDTKYIVVNEAGASVYSTSTVAQEEFPDYDATVRGTISIGRRIQDPLSELVKIDPRHIGVGMYQHDVNPRKLQESLDQVIESCVNSVGVNLNTASSSLLSYVSGLNQLMARRVVEHRRKNGEFTAREQLLDITGIGKATFTQAAGFLKIPGGEQPLDATWIHPESYDATERLLKRVSLSPADLLTKATETKSFQEQLTSIGRSELATELSVGLSTLNDIVNSLLRPGEDPRTELPGPIFREGILKLNDLTAGMELTGTVLNVVDFGAFVDIGLKNSGLIHISRLSNGYVSSPHDVLSVGDVVTVWVDAVDTERKRVSLSKIKPGSDVPKAERTSPAKPKSATKPTSTKTSDSQTSGSQTPQNLNAKKTRQNSASGPHKKPHRGKSKPAPLKKLSKDVEEGRAPMRGFDELNALWKKKPSD
ncbi:UNVERIFIED_CONTAM: hypothetical protein GTU68_061590 [Idotea baltica]|nr:hypothetical protein [Idotea baltica]